MTKSVLDIGNCDPDHFAIKQMFLSCFDVEVLRAAHLSDAQKWLESRTIDLILINRKLDIDYSDGIEVLKTLKSSEGSRRIPVMLVTNYPEHQEAAVAAGGEYGFGKLELHSPATLERLRKFLPTR
jgi:response regulator RpfG family c-di-GMP phosphodiesterase